MLKKRNIKKLLVVFLILTVTVSTCLLSDFFVKANQDLSETKEGISQKEVITESTNILLGKMPSTNATDSQRLEKATDGDHSNLMGEGGDVTQLISGQDEKLGAAQAEPVYLQYDFGEAKVIEKIKIYRFIYERDYCKYYAVKVMLSNDPAFSDPAQTITVFGGENGTDVADRAPEGSEDVFSDITERVIKGSPQEIIPNLTEGYRYIRFISKGHAGSWDSNGYSNKVRYAELEAYAQEPISPTVDVNILEYLMPQKWDGALMNLNSGGTVGQQVKILNSELATDGDRAQENTDGNQQFTTLSAGEGSDDGQIPQGNIENYIQYEFKEERPVKRIEIYRDTYAGNSTYAGRICTFKKVKVALSMDENFTNPVYVYGSAENGIDYQETTNTRGEPQVILLSDNPITAKYIRIYGQGSFHDNQKGWSHYYGENNYAEIKVFSEYNRDELPPENGTELNIAFKEPYAYGKGLKEGHLLYDGNWDTYAENLSTGSGAWINYDFVNRYRITKIKFKLENDNYRSIKVMLSGNPYFTTYNTVFQENNFDYQNAVSGSITDIAQWTYDNTDQSITITLDEPIGTQHIRFAIDRGTQNVKLAEAEIYAMLPDGITLEEIKQKEQRIDYNPSSDYIPSYSQYDKLVWSDEFNGNAVDETKWNIIDGMVNHGAIYNRGAVSVRDGNLVINTKNYDSYDNLAANVGVDVYEDENPNKDIVTWSSGRVETKNKYSFQYGRVAVRAKVNDSKGVWPAIWMLCQDETGHDEIDILEYLGHDGSGDGLYYAWTTNHYGVYKVNKGSDGTATLNYEPWSQAYHIYEVEWSPEQIQFYIDGKLVKTTTAGKDKDGMHTRAMFAILETQIGASWVGDVDYTKNLTKQDSDYLVDWIRVYQKADSDIIRFDDCESFKDTDNSDYTIVPENTSGENTFLRMTDGTNQPEKKNNFIYGGQPRYEKNRLAAKTPGAYLTYKIQELKDVHLTTYYQTIEGATIGSGGNIQGVSIRDKMADNADLDFKMYISKTGKEDSWEELKEGTNCTKLQAFKNCVEQYPLFGRITFDAYGLPEGTNYIKIVFPDITGKKYIDNKGNQKAVEKTDIQLAKVTFNQRNIQDNKQEEDTNLIPSGGDNSNNTGSLEKETEQTIKTDKDKTTTTTTVKDKNTELKITEISTEKEGTIEIYVSVSTTNPEIKKDDIKTQISIQLPHKVLSDLIKKLPEKQNIQMQIDIPKETILEQIKESNIKSLEFSLVIPTEEQESKRLTFSEINLAREILEIAKQDGKDFSFRITDGKNNDTYTWSFKGQSLQKSKNKIEDINMALQVVPITNISEEKIKTLIQDDKNNENGLVIELKHSGVFPDTAYVKIKVGNQGGIKPNGTAYLYYFNQQKNKLDIVPDNEYTIDENGYIIAKLVHCSDYILVPQKASNLVSASLLEQVKVTPSKKKLNKQETKKINITLPPTIVFNSDSDNFTQDATTVVEVSYKSKNKKIADVSKQGKITAKKKGKTKIITTLKLSNEQKKKFKTIVTVK